jgi:hypothetical protein
MAKGLREKAMFAKKALLNLIDSSVERSMLNLMIVMAVTMHI